MEGDAFARLFEAHYGAVVAYARRRGDAWDQAEDVAAEVFATAWRRRDDIPPGWERAWLLATARRVQANRWRGARRGSALVARLWAASSTPWPDDPGGDTDRPLHEALASLTARDREVLRLVAWDGLTHAAVGHVLGCSTSAATSRIVRARRRLRRALDAHPSDDLRGAR